MNDPVPLHKTFLFKKKQFFYYLFMAYLRNARLLSIALNTFITQNFEL